MSRAWPDKWTWASDLDDRRLMPLSLAVNALYMDTGEHLYVGKFRSGYAVAVMGTGGDSTVMVSQAATEDEAVNGLIDGLRPKIPTQIARLRARLAVLEHAFATWGSEP